jgi:hypothetical protein
MFGSAGLADVFGVPLHVAAADATSPPSPPPPITPRSDLRPWQTSVMELRRSERAAVDVTLIDETLALSPLERLRQNDRTIRMIESLRDGLAADRSDPPPR